MWNYTKRLEIEKLFKEGLNLREVTEYCKCNENTVRNELRKGTPDGKKNRYVLYSAVRAVKYDMVHTVGADAYDAVIKWEKENDNEG